MMLRLAFLLSAIVLLNAALAETSRAAAVAVEAISPDQALSFVDSKVKQQDKKVIGRTVNVVVQDGAPQRAIIDLDGFMGIGNHAAVVPWKDLRFDPAADGVQVTLDLSPDQIRTMAKVKPSEAPPTTAPPQTEPRVAPTPPVAPELGLKLIDSTLKDAQGKSLGKICDVLVDHAAQVRAVVVTPGGTLDLNGRRIVISWRAIHFGSVKGKPEVTTEVTPDQVKAASEYHAGKPAAAILPADQSAASAQ